AARYGIERELGRGGMATVYLADDAKHHRTVAVKVLRPELAAVLGPERFLREVEIAARLNHPHILALYDSGEADGFLFYVMPYMSPEQGAGEQTRDARSDVYSLGCVLYEMLAGEPPYTGPTVQALIAKVMVDPVPAVRRLRPTVPPGVDQALRRALAKAPADRFASMAAFVDALSAPPQPRPPSVAVLPFRNLSADPENEYFADGITEDVIAHLSKIR